MLPKCMFLTKINIYFEDSLISIDNYFLHCREVKFTSNQAEVDMSSSGNTILSWAKCYYKIFFSEQPWKKLLFLLLLDGYSWKSSLWSINNVEEYLWKSSLVLSIHIVEE